MKKMDKNLIKLIFFILLYLFFCNTFQFANENKDNKLLVLTEDFVPFNYIEKGKITGFTTEIVEILIKKTNTKIVRGKILLWPWKRAYETALKEKNVLLFTTTRTPERENLFKWVGPIYPRKQWLFKLKNRTDIQIKLLDDAKQYKIVDVEHSANYQFLLKNGYIPDKNLLSTNTWESKINMFLAGRVDLVCYLPMEFAYRLKQVDQSYDIVEPLFIVSGDMYYYLAFSKDTSDEIIEKFQTALEEMKRDGSYQIILDKYLK